MALALTAVVIAFLSWWIATGAVILLVRRKVPHALYLILPASALAIAGMGTLFAVAGMTSVAAVYTAFFAALLIWAFHEVTFLLGHVTGPRRLPCPPGAKGRLRFQLAFAAVRDHELGLFLTAAALIVIFAGAANPFGWMLFALMWVMRLMTKLNVFLGAPNAVSDILPERMDYLTSYFRTDRVHPFFIVSVVAITALFTVCVFMAASAVVPGAIVGWSLLATFAFLGLIEHLFLVLPVRDAALWGWAVGKGGGGFIKPARQKPSTQDNNKKTAAPVLS